MTKLNDIPVLFVHYPTGAGGWFLASLLHYAFDQTVPFSFDSYGSGHSNQSIRLINNWYDEVVCSPVGMAIIHNDEYDKYSRDERIEFLRNNLQATDMFKQGIPHVISLHCVDINLFLEAFPNSKCIQIIVEEHNLLVCTVLFLMKKLSFEQFVQFTKQFDVPESSYKELFSKLNQIQSRSELEDFKWAVPYVQSLDKGVENNPEYDDRFLEIMFEDWMNDDSHSVLHAFLNFVGVESPQKIFDNLIMYIEKYRSQQPNFVKWGYNE